MEDLTLQQKQRTQLEFLDDYDLVSLYMVAFDVLRKRGILAKTRKQINTALTNSRPQKFCTPIEYNKNKIKRCSNHSILIDFLSQDWKYLFNGDFDTDKKYYVYYHTKPNMSDMVFEKDGEEVTFRGRPFYVGKGTGDRYKNKKRSRSHLSKINELKRDGADESSIFCIFRDGLTELEALEMESKLITFFGCSNEISRNKAHFHGIKGGLLCNTDPSKRPLELEKHIQKV